MSNETKIYDAFAAADKVAPQPDRGATGQVWGRHYAALALAAHTAFRVSLPTIGSNPEPGSRPDLGLICAVATSSTAAAVALLSPPLVAPDLIWNLTPEAGALNGEYVDWLAERCDQFGINPAALYRWYSGADFDSPSVLAESEVA